MIVMNAMSVLVRTASVTGCKTFVAVPDSMAAAVEGGIGQRGGDADRLLARCILAVAAGIEKGQRGAGQHHHRDHQDLQCDGLPGQERGQARAGSCRQCVATPPDCEGNDLSK